MLHEWPNWFNLLDEGVAFVDLKGCFIRVNDSFTELVGYSHTELVGRSVKLITHPDDADGNNTELEKVLSGELEHYALLKRYITKYGNSVWVKVVVYPIRKDGKITHLFKQAITIKNGAREQIKKVNNEITVVETLSIDSFVKKHWWRLLQILSVILITLGGWVYNATMKMYADSARLDRIERVIDESKGVKHEPPDGQSDIPNVHP